MFHCVCPSLNYLMILDRYTREARLYPAIGTLLPFLLLYYFYLQPSLSGFVNSILGLTIGGVTVSIALIFFLMETNRFISKMLLEMRYFRHELKMPTTNFLLYQDDTYSEDQKDKIRKKIYKDFAKQLPSKHDESSDELAARRLITEGVAMVRAKMKGGRLILQQNIHYGAARNLIGGAFIALPMSILDAVIFFFVSPNRPAAIISIVFIVMYGLLILFGKYITTKQGEYYARVLFQEYLGS
jgi:hypothetical protein